MRLYPDSCIAIYLVEERERLAAAIRARLLPDEDGPEIVISDLTRLECRIWPKRAGHLALLERYDAFFGTPGFQRVPMDVGVFDMATDLRAESGLKTADALHLAAAIVSGCEELWTNDGRFAAAAANRLRAVTFSG